MELHQRVDDGLRMHHRLDALQRDVEEPLGLDNFQALVHQRGAVDGNLGAHLPVGMAKCLGKGHLLQLLARVAAERPSRSGDNKLLDGIVMFAGQCLEDGGVLRIDRIDEGLHLAGLARHQLAGHHQSLLVGQSYELATLDGVIDRRQTGHSHDTGEHHIHALHLADVAQ